MKMQLAALLLVALVAAASAQTPEPDCSQCGTHLKGRCEKIAGRCDCKLFVGVEEQKIDCTKLISKCVLMRREMYLAKGEGRSLRPDTAVVDNDGIYLADCDNNGAFKARQCNETDTCWCVNSAGVRRTEKGGKDWKCEPVRTFWIQIELKENGNAELALPALKQAITKTISKRYGLKENHVKDIEYKDSYVFIDLVQNSTEKTAGDVDITEVAYYMERDIKGESLLPSENKFEILVDGKPLSIEQVKIFYMDEKPPEFSMKHLTPGVIAVIVVVVLAIVAGIAVLVFTRRRRTGKYQKAEVKEMGEMHSQLST
ncbi:epithelial cell adhesion molecule [Microcaecilia unicolor]|uniref:Epithelial cell adhesion molecule n=1 Tax=Microcaecilia unicolor TaxID=1415580 RepID=A0A6P7XGT9_9AMPH|nr:epithelial cell adhesion molecule [Microcaecilia unicolor]